MGSGVEVLRRLWLEARGGSPRIAAAHRATRALLPEDEDYVVRYVAACGILLARVAHADGTFVRAERLHLRRLLERCGRIDETQLDVLTDALDRSAAEMTGGEIDACLRELRSLCDVEQRERVLRLLAGQATSDGVLAPSEHRVLREAADALRIDRERLRAIV